MPIKTTIGVAALAVAACFMGTGASASPVALGKPAGVTGATVQNVDYYCYHRNGRRYCRDDDYDDTYYDYDYDYGPGIVIGGGRGRGHHHHGGGGGGGMHYYRSPGGGGVGHGPIGGGSIGHAPSGGFGGGMGGGMGGHGHR